MPFRRAVHIAVVSLWLSGCWQRPDHALHAKLPKTNNYQVNIQASDSTVLPLMTKVWPEQKHVMLLCL